MDRDRLRTLAGVTPPQKRDYEQDLKEIVDLVYQAAEAMAYDERAEAGSAVSGDDIYHYANEMTEEVKSRISDKIESEHMK